MKRGVGIIGFTVLLVGFVAAAVWASSYPAPRFRPGDTVVVLPQSPTNKTATVIAGPVRAFDMEHGRTWEYEVQIDGLASTMKIQEVNLGRASARTSRTTAAQSRP